MKNRLGCITLPGLLATLAALVLISAISLVKGGVLFSPGALNAQAGVSTLGGARSHADIAACSSCHAAPWDAQGMNGRCLDCHTDVNRPEKDFHRLMLAQAQTSACFTCHTDHHGAQASLTNMNLRDFPHDEVGFSLLTHRKMPGGKPFTCSDCHANKYTDFSASTCRDCHLKISADRLADHLSIFGEDCLACHDGRETFSRNFDHNLTAFPLEGKHADLNCGACHAGVRRIADFQAAPQDCFSCHAQDDPHGEQFGRDCAACHTPEAWKPAIFDHSKAAFPLTGAHLDLPCEHCHAAGKFKGTPMDCIACHQQDDHHQGQFGADCAACHSTATWKDALFDHTLASFRLTGAHAGVACSSCHPNEQFKGTPVECAACHSEPAFHAGLFGPDCTACHTTSGWSPATYNEAHLFPLNHGNPGSCRDCHPNSLKEYTCYTCHNAAQMDAKHREEGVGDLANCMKCHPTGNKEGGGEDGDD